MGMLSQLLAEVKAGGTEFVDGLKWLVVVLVSIAGSLCILYAIYIGYLFATATDDGKRRAAKDRLIKVISSGLIIFALAMCLTVIDVNFSKPVADGREEETENEDLLEGMTGATGGFFYKYYQNDPMWITTNAVHTVKIDAANLWKGNNAMDMSKFGGFTNFEFNVADSAFQNSYGKEGEGEPAEISNDGKMITYKYRAVGGDATAVVDYYKVKGDGDKFWKGTISFTYDGLPCSAIGYFAVNNGRNDARSANFPWGQKLADVVID